VTLEAIFAPGGALQILILQREKGHLRATDQGRGEKEEKQKNKG
jgi:hypothetical protein